LWRRQQNSGGKFRMCKALWLIKQFTNVYHGICAKFFGIAI
jgi:hypothetical protein